jgi:hypothetical protein
MGTGCAGTVHPPVNPTDPVTVYLADYGRHSSIVLPDGDNQCIEWAFGDWRWFALGDTKTSVALAAMLHSPQAALGRREITPQPDDQAMQRTLQADHVVHFQVSSERAKALLDALERRYARHADTQIHSDYAQLDMVKDNEHYWVLHNCNHVTMHWLKKLGCRVDGMGVLSNFKLAG